jgi:hypothetical protein
MSWNLGGTLDELGLICPRAAQFLYCNASVHSDAARVPSYDSKS